MRYTERDALAQYLLRKHQELENDLTDCRDTVRWRDADEVDCLELMLARTRLRAFKEFFADVNALLKVFEKY